MVLRRISAALLAALFFSITVPSAASADALAQGAQAAVSGLSERAITELTDPEIDRETRKTRLRLVMNEYFHVEGIARWVLGRNWRKASADEQAEYLALYEDLMIETYVDRFANHQGEKLEVGKVDTSNGKDAIVDTEFYRPGTEKPVLVQWRVRDVLGKYKVIDVMIEGVSMGQTQRSEFASAIKGADGDIAQFLVNLRSRVETASAAATQTN